MGQAPFPKLGDCTCHLQNVSVGFWKGIVGQPITIIKLLLQMLSYAWQKDGSSKGHSLLMYRCDSGRVLMKWPIFFIWSIQVGLPRPEGRTQILQQASANYNIAQ